MNIEAYGIRLERLRKEDIELVREKRNSPEINQFMEFREYISPEMQAKWFNSLDRLKDFYFVINYHGDKIGLIHTSDIHWEDKTANSGLFIWEKNYWGTHAPVLASLAMLDAFMGVFGLKYYYAKVLNTNNAALIYNSKLGFEEVPGQKMSKFKTLLLTKTHYIERAEEIRRTANRLTKASETRISINDDLGEFLFTRQGIVKPDEFLGKIITLIPV